MSINSKITLADVRASINPDNDIHPSVKYFGRPLANLITPFFHNAGWTANQLTVARSFLAVGGIVLLAFPSPLLWQLSVIVYCLCFILDYADGNLARVQNDASYLGKFLDGLSDFVYPLTATFFLGIGTWLYYDEPRLIILGAIISMVGITNQLVRNRLSFFREWMVSLTGALTQEELQAAEGPRALQGKLAMVMVSGYIIAILVLAVPQWGPALFFAACILFQFIPDFLWTCSSLVEANALLRRHRKSGLASGAPAAE